MEIILGIPNLSFDEEGLCVLSFGEEVLCLSLREKTEQIMVYADVGALEKPAPPSVLTGLLEANCLQPEGLTIGIRLDSERNLYVVAQSLLIDLAGMDQERFQNLLERFITRQETWDKDITRLRNHGAHDEENLPLEHPSSSIRA